MDSGNKMDNLVWVDLEMTGLDATADVILEMACLITDGHLNIIAEGPEIVVHQSDDVLNNMNEWCKEHHGASGLTERVRSSTTSVEEAERLMVEFIQKHVGPRTSPLCGNTVHMDKRFLDKYMPKFSEYLHYRIIDVSTLKELARRWYPVEFMQAPKKNMAHRALGDIKESIEELRYYKQTLFK